MAIGLLAPVKINVNERPSQMLYRLGDPASEGGSVYTEREREQLHALHRHWIQNFRPLVRQLPEHHVLGELNALKIIETLGRPPAWTTAQTPIALVGDDFFGPVFIALVALAIGLSFVQEYAAEPRTTKDQKLNRLIQKLEQELNAFDKSYQTGQISEIEFQQKRRELIRTALQANR